MFCFQYQEAAKSQGCTVKGVCGKPEETADLQDLLKQTEGTGVDVYTHGRCSRPVTIRRSEHGLRMRSPEDMGTGQVPFLA